jgi:hypothetical protein
MWGWESYIVFLLQSDSSIAIRFPLLVILASGSCGFLGPLANCSSTRRVASAEYHNRQVRMRFVRVPLECLFSNLARVVTRLRTPRLVRSIYMLPTEIPRLSVSSCLQERGKPRIWWGRVRKEIAAAPSSRTVIVVQGLGLGPGPAPS